MYKLATIGFDRLKIENFPENHYFLKLQRWFDSWIETDVFGHYIVINGVPIQFDPNQKAILVNMSAGADSTLLTYLLALIIDTIKCDTKIYISSVVRYARFGNFSTDAKKDVYSYINNKFPNILVEQIWGFIPSAFEYTKLENINLMHEPEHIKRHYNDVLIPANANSDVLFFHQYTEWLAKKYNISNVYNATTTNPITSTDIPGAPAFRNKHNLLSHIPRAGKKDDIFDYVNCGVFRFLEKSWTTAQYDNLNISDLYKITQSCDIKFNGCGDLLACFHCAERDWAERNKFYYLKENNL